EASTFQYCSSLTTVVIPNSVTSIGNWAFGSCSSLTGVVVPDSVTSIGSYAFIACTNLTNVTIPNSVTNIGDHAFYYCSGLTAINVDPLNKDYSSMDGVLFNKSQTLLLRYPAGKAGSFAIPNSVTSIGEEFEFCTRMTS